MCRWHLNLYVRNKITVCGQISRFMPLYVIGVIQVMSRRVRVNWDCVVCLESAILRDLHIGCCFSGIWNNKSVKSDVRKESKKERDLLNYLQRWSFVPQQQQLCVLVRMLWHSKIKEKVSWIRKTSKMLLTLPESPHAVLSKLNGHIHGCLFPGLKRTECAHSNCNNHEKLKTLSSNATQRFWGNCLLQLCFGRTWQSR